MVKFAFACACMSRFLEIMGESLHKIMHKIKEKCFGQSRPGLRIAKQKTNKFDFLIGAYKVGGRWH